MPVMCWVPRWKRQPFHCKHRASVGYGQSNRFERIASGTLIVIPPSASIRSLKLLKSTTTAWSIGTPVNSLTVLIARAAPPAW